MRLKQGAWNFFCRLLWNFGVLLNVYLYSLTYGTLESAYMNQSKCSTLSFLLNIIVCIHALFERDLNLKVLMLFLCYFRFSCGLSQFPSSVHYLLRFSLSVLLWFSSEICVSLWFFSKFSRIVFSLFTLFKVLSNINYLFLLIFVGTGDFKNSFCISVLVHSTYVAEICCISFPEGVFDCFCVIVDLCWWSNNSYSVVFYWSEYFPDLFYLCLSLN